MEAQQNGHVSELKNELTEMFNGVVLPEMCGIHEQYIYKVPQRIRQANPQAYTPQIISIGPFHNPHMAQLVTTTFYTKWKNLNSNISMVFLIEQSYVWMILFSNFKSGKIELEVVMQGLLALIAMIS